MEILCLHRVLARPTPADEPYLTRGTAIGVDELRALLDSGRTFVDEDGLFPDDPTACWLTFDDGYADVVEVAAPELARRGIRASLFVSTAALDPSWRHPVDRWYATIVGARRRRVTLDGLGLARREVDLAREEDWRSLVNGPEKDHFVAASREEQRDMLARLTRLLEPAGVKPPRLLSRAELVRLAALGWRIGAHGRTHAVLRDRSARELADEIDGALEDLAFLGTARSAWFAWPDGRSDASARAWLAARASAHGVRGALALDPDAPGDRWQVPRRLVVRANTLESKQTSGALRPDTARDV